jgi:hypothetical protein
MEHDERERRDPSQEDDRSPLDDPGTGEPSAAAMPQPPASDPTADPDATSTWETPSTPDPSDAAATEEAAPAEIESWPSQEPTAAEPTAAEPIAADPVAADAAAPIPPAEPAWPTEPPAAGSGAEDSWPTEPPERGDEPILAPDWQSTEPVEADVTPDPSGDWHTDAEPATDAAGDAPGDWRTADADLTPDATDVVAAPPPSEVEAYPASPPPADAALAAAAVPAHSVPDGSAVTGESTQCPRCGTENRPGLAFCRNCGQRLVAAGVATTVERPGTPEGTQACPRCGTHNRNGVAFCQNCGANLRGTAEGYVPPAVADEAAPAAVVAERGGAVLGPIVLLIGVIGLVTGYLLPFLYGSGSLFERAWGSGGSGVAFWSDYPEVGAALADQAYFGLAAPVPLLAALLVVLAIAGFVRAAPGMLQSVGLVAALLWSAGLAILFVVVELAANWDGDLVSLLRALTPAGIIFFLSALIVLIGTLTRFARS